MTTGTWFVLCDRAHAIATPDLVARLAGLADTTVQLDDGAIVILAYDDLTERHARLTVGLSSEPHVKLESAEIAENHAAGRPDRDRIASADARYEFLWDLRETDELFNTLLVVAQVIEKACGGIVYDVNSGEFVD